MDYYNDRKEKSKDDVMLKLCKAQGYVPDGCVLAGVLVYSLMQRPPGDPCKGCNENRKNCGGRPR